MINADLFTDHYIGPTVTITVELSTLEKLTKYMELNNRILDRRGDEKHLYFNFLDDNCIDNAISYSASLFHSYLMNEMTSVEFANEECGISEDI